MRRRKSGEENKRLAVDASPGPAALVFQNVNSFGRDFPKNRGARC